ncbi:MAG TPA: hypothetical protein VI078_16220 [bacterium]
MKARRPARTLVALATLAVLAGAAAPAAPAAQVQCQQFTATGSLVAGDTTGALRLFQAEPSGCAAPKACPGSSGPGPFFFDTYSFRNGPAARCATATLTNHCGAATRVHASAYGGSFDPADPCLNYLGDVGTAPPDGGAASFSFIVPASQTLVMVLNTTVASAECPAYDLQLSGCSDWGALWSAAGSTGVAANPGAVTFAGPVVQLKPTTALRVAQTLRYGTSNLKLDPDGFWRIRFRDNGAASRLRVWFKHADARTGALRTLMSFDSNTRPASAGFQLVEIPTSGIAVPVSGACWIEATLDKTGGTGSPALHSMDFIAP